MSHFDIIKSFHNEEEWNEISNTDKSKNFFMFNRYMAMKYPLQAHGFNHTKIDPAKTVDWFRSMFVTKKEPINFIWISTGKKEKAIRKKAIPQEVFKFLCEKYEISMREINNLMEFYPLEFQKYCESVKEMIS